jgi:S1-C subfamily serine protease
MGRREDVMATASMLTAISDEMADMVARVAPSVVQVQGRHRPASGLVYSDHVVVTTVSALGREDGLRVRQHDGGELDADLTAWDPATGVAVLRVASLSGRPLLPGDQTPRVGHLAVALARSWSGALTASAGIISIIGGPLPTGRRRSIDEVIRTTALMHDGFAGGAFLDTAGRLIGMTTAASIRGLSVVIPSPIVWKTAAGLLEHGKMKRGYLGIAGQPARLPDTQRPNPQRAQALLVVGVTPDSPADKAGVLVGDLVLEFDRQPIESPEDLMARLHSDSIGRELALRVLRGTTDVTVTVVVGERIGR